MVDASTEANHWELFAFSVLLDLFPEVVRDRHVVVWSDSVSAISCVRDMSACLDSPVLAHLTRGVLGQCVRLNVRILPMHVAGVENVLADPLSRGNWRDFAAQAESWLRVRGKGPSSYMRSMASWA